MPKHERRGHSRNTRAGRTAVKRTTVQTKERGKSDGKRRVRQADQESDRSTRARVVKASGRKAVSEKQKGSDNKTTAKESAKAGIDEV